MLLANKPMVSQLYKAGAFGNKTQSFALPDAVPQALRSGLFGVRSMTPGDKRFKTDIPYQEAVELYREIGQAAIYESLPLAWSVINFEVARTEQGMTLRYVLGPGFSCRDVNGPHVKYAVGAAAIAIMKAYMDAQSWDWLNHLLDTHDHPTRTTTVEVTVADRPVGELGWNSVFWEVRHY